jgi:hypothetical protein
MHLGKKWSFTLDKVAEKDLVKLSCDLAPFSSRILKAILCTKVTILLVGTTNDSLRVFLSASFFFDHEELMAKIRLIKKPYNTVFHDLLSFTSSGSASTIQLQYIISRDDKMMR